MAHNVKAYFHAIMLWAIQFVIFSTLSIVSYLYRIYNKKNLIDTLILDIAPMELNSFLWCHAAAILVYLTNEIKYCKLTTVLSRIWNAWRAFRERSLTLKTNAYFWRNRKQRARQKNCCLFRLMWIDCDEKKWARRHTY